MHFLAPTKIYGTFSKNKAPLFTFSRPVYMQKKQGMNYILYGAIMGEMSRGHLIRRVRPYFKEVRYTLIRLRTKVQEDTVSRPAHQSTGNFVFHNPLWQVHCIGHSQYNQASGPATGPVKQVVQDGLLASPQQIQLVSQ